MGGDGEGRRRGEGGGVEGEGEGGVEGKGKGGRGREAGEQRDLSCRDSAFTFPLERINSRGIIHSWTTGSEHEISDLFMPLSE